MVQILLILYCGIKLFVLSSDKKILSAWLYVEGHMRGHWMSHFNQEGVVPLSRGLSFNKVCKYTCILNVCLTPLLALCDSSLVNTSLDHTLIMVSRG